MENEKQITIGDLARMVQKGFVEINERMATKEDIERLENKFEKLDNKISFDHGLRIEKLETDMKEMKDALAM